MKSETHPVEIEFLRGEIVESVHRAHYCIIDSDGKILDHRGNPNLLTYLRSAAKPFQSMAVIISGAADKFELTRAELGILCGSHGGEEYHIETVREMLDRAGLSVNQLQCGIHSPLDKSARIFLYKNENKPNLLHHTCSGKHTGMLLSALCNNVQLGNYLSRESEVQIRINQLIAEFAGIEQSEIVIGTDGCSAPAHGLKLKSAALAYARFINPEGLSPEITVAANRVSRAMRAFPEMVGANQDRICTDLMRLGRVFNLTAKAGAEAFYSLGWKDPKTGRGIGMAIKVEDGAERARNPLIIELLQKYGIIPHDLSQSLLQYASTNILNNNGKVVGRINVNN